MPFASKLQSRWMFANKPEMAKRWAKHTKNIKALPEKVKEAAETPAPGHESGSLTKNLVAVPTALAAGTLTGNLLYQGLLRPSNVEIGNLQKRRMLDEYDSLIGELRARIATRQGRR